MQQLYESQGIDVPEDVVAEGVRALEQERFVYRPPQRTFAVRLAEVYVEKVIGCDDGGRITFSIDTLNRKFGKRVLSVGPWTPPPGGYAGGKISYTRIPSAEDFW